MMRNRSRSRAAGRPTHYQIVVRGELSQRFAMAFEGMSLEAEDGQTVITGPVVDQAHLPRARQCQRHIHAFTPH
jgi:hypothetical protein